MLPASVSSDDVLLLEREDSSTSATVHLFGATLISWIRGGEEFIFLSSKAKFDGKSAIRGGIPLVFPCFGPWSNGPQHGFARISRWSVETPPTKDSDGNVMAALSLVDSEETRKMWNNRFKLIYKVTLMKDSLKTEFKVINRNTEDIPFTFTCLLHTYLHVDDITKITISNLSGLKYIDKSQGGQTFTEDRDPVTIDKFTDYTYVDTPDTHRVSGATGGRIVQLTKHNLPDTVVWNPWEKARDMSDLDGYEKMVCVEAGHVSKHVHLSPSHEYTSHQIITILD